ncbi:MAG TPA: hypothetical protein VFU85_02815, partial [Nocardioides sp.]|nr:hypothetical protein [Nocardioides sp.]
VAEQLPVGVRATGVALTYGLATATLGGTAPLVGSLLAQAGAANGIAAYVAMLAGAGLWAALRPTGMTVAATEPTDRRGGTVEPPSQLRPEAP